MVSPPIIMTDKPEPNPNSETDYQLDKDILSGRKFTLADVIGREGGSFLKGESPIPILTQAINEINGFISQNLADSPGALKIVLQTWVKNDSGVTKKVNQPLIALRDILESITSNLELLYEFVRQVDFQWGQMYDELPHFQPPGKEPHPDDEYTHESVKKQLTDLLEKVNNHLSI